MLSLKSVIPECNIDSNLFDVLLNFEKESVNHTKGNGTVVTKMADKFADKFCVGIIDKDRRDLKQIKENFDQVNIEGVNEYFKLYQCKDKQKHHYIIQMVPVIETWIWNVTFQLDIKIYDFITNVTSITELKEVTKKVAGKKDTRFKALFKEIISQSTDKNFLPVLKLKRIIGLILDKNYQTDINELING
jgi:hypothetical protein